MKGAARTQAVSSKHRKHAAGPIKRAQHHSLDDADVEASASILEFLPPKEERVMEGNVEKKAISSRGIKYQPRLAVLSREHLVLGKARKLGSHLTASTEDVNINGITSESLHAAFEKWDGGHKGHLNLQETTDALLELKMVSKQHDIESLFRQFDADGSSSLEWEEFKQIARHAADNNSVIDFIPLCQIDAVEFDLVEREPADKPRNEAGNMQKERRVGVVELVQIPGAVDGDDPDKVKMEKPKKEPKKSASLVQGLLQAIEKSTGIDIDGDGNKMSDIKLPKFNADLFEVTCVSVCLSVCLSVCVCRLVRSSLSYCSLYTLRRQPRKHTTAFRNCRKAYNSI